MRGSMSVLFSVALAARASSGAGVGARAAPALYETLTSTPFKHVGVVLASDAYTYVPRACSYLEPENVTVAPASGIGWTEGGACPLLYACPANGCFGECAPEPADPNTDRPGGDYRAFQLATPTPAGAECATTCCGEAACLAWAYAPAAPAGQEPSCAAGLPCCYLKSSVSPASPLAGVFSGTVSRGAAPNVTAPPMGLRSAVPLGGLGAGAFELRADGTVHEVTIVNQSPAGAAKYGVLEDLMLGARVGGVARALRTAPPLYAAGAGASALAYSALYPLASLAFADATDFAPAAVDGVGVFAYSTLVPGDPAASAVPAVAFTLAISNVGDTPLDVDLFISLPLASVNDCARPSKLPPVASLPGSTGPAACLAACAAAPTCASWTIASDAMCVLAVDVPLSVHAPGAFCGVRGAFSADGTALTLAMPCPATAPGPACGDVTLHPVGEGGATPSVGAAPDAGALWDSFASTGGFTSGKGVSAGAFSGAEVGHGAAAVSITVPPRSNGSVSIVMAWSFPHRDHDVEDIGNFYSTVFADSAETARALAAPGALERVAVDLAAHHGVFAGAGSSLPDWLSDFAVNAVSHFRGMIYSRDGRMREFEAFDCMDLDSIHNDYQRHLPYLWLAPQFEIQKLKKWGSGQDASGYIQEFLGPFGVGPFDIPGGRIMGDTTTLWVVELYEVWKETGDDALVAELWPTAARAIGWLVENAAPLGLPEKLYSTYDILCA